jgi:hypothetical protein
MKFRRRFLALGWAAGIAASGGENRAPDLASAWQALSIGSYDAAFAQFDALGGSRAARLGAALAVMQRAPMTTSSLAAARERFTALTAIDDEYGHAAHYFLGRLAGLNAFTPEPVEAALHFEHLAASGADDTWCRLALVKLAILRLSGATGKLSDEPRLASAEPLLARTRDPTTLRDLHVVIADARLHARRYDATTLAHLRAAFDLTPAGDTARADLAVQVGRLAEILGDRAVAEQHYRLFLEENPRERRAYTVSDALAKLEGPTR